MNAIEIHNLTKSYGKNRGVINLDLTVKKGDIFGYLGPNGAGKSTTIRCLLGLTHFDEGDVKVLGMDVKTETKQILSQIGYVPSEAQFYPNTKFKDIKLFTPEMRSMSFKG